MTGSASGSNRVNRGGSWNNNASNCTVSNRNNNNPNNRNNNLGFRVVRSSSLRKWRQVIIRNPPEKAFRTGLVPGGNTE